MTHPDVATIDRRFTADDFTQRRARLLDRIEDGLVLLPGQGTVWRNADRPHPFRQASHVLYTTGISRPGLALVLDADSGEATLYGPPDTLDDLVWHGPHPSLDDLAAEAGISDVRDYDELQAALRDARQAGRPVHYPPLFEPGTLVEVARLLGQSVDEARHEASDDLKRALGEVRAVKSESEVAEIEDAVAISAEMYAAAFRVTAPGVHEFEVLAAMREVMHRHDRAASFNPIVSVRGEVLHSDTSPNLMRDGDLLLIDSGVETSEGYASDITRTIPVSGRFTDQQRAVYEVVLASQDAAIEAVRPGANFRDIHLIAARTIAAGLTDIGLMKGDPNTAVEAGAHALFFVHGLGHPIGLDVHDVQDLGDTYAYPPDQPRSDQFGLGFLRFARDLAPGHVVTIEPGIYFIPALIDAWQLDGRHADFINYEALSAYRGFGGIRIEDDVLCTESGSLVLGPGIPKAVSEIEQAMA